MLSLSFDLTRKKWMDFRDAVFVLLANEFYKHQGFLLFWSYVPNLEMGNWHVNKEENVLDLN